MACIYGLADPNTGELRYVGKTVMPLTQRLGFHCNRAELSRKNDTHKNNWVKKLLREGKRPEIFVVEEHEEEGLYDAEQFWISYFRSIGCYLTNATDGGPGAKGYKHSDETKLKMRKPKTKRISAQGRANMAAAHRGRMIRDQHGNTYPSIMAAARAAGVPYQNVGTVLKRGRGGALKGFIFSEVTP
jgi:hypothetical protein